MDDVKVSEMRSQHLACGQQAAACFCRPWGRNNGSEECAVGKDVRVFLSIVAELSFSKFVSDVYRQPRRYQASNTYHKDGLRFSDLDIVWLEDAAWVASHARYSVLMMSCSAMPKREISGEPSIFPWNRLRNTLHYIFSMTISFSL